MKRRYRPLNHVLNWVLLVDALLTLATGLVMLIGFHAGHHARATSGLGLPRIVWLDLHRLFATVMGLGVLVHVALHLRLFNRRVTRYFSRGARRRFRWFDTELVMVLAMGAALVTGFALWWAVAGSSPWLGPARLGPGTVRHRWIDTHYVVSLIGLVFVVHHIGHRLRRMVPPKTRTARARDRAPDAR